MYSHILVPLDGSKLAEQVLPHVRLLAGGQHGGKVTLLRAVPTIYPLTTEITGAVPLAIEEGLMAAHHEAREYLEHVASELQSAGLHVQIEVSTQPAAEAIIDYVEQHGVTLIMIATHGRSGLGRWVFGSVTQKVLHTAEVPVLVVPPTHDAAWEGRKKQKKMLVSL
jgi:nucleotide-binding universal stress UspA family protein